MLGVENEKKKNYAMVKLVTPKRVALPNGRTFIAQYKTIKRFELPPHIVMKIKKGSNRDRAFFVL